jgi:hypothetical protein
MKGGSFSRCLRVRSKEPHVLLASSILTSFAELYLSTTDRHPQAISLTTLAISVLLAACANDASRLLEPRALTETPREALASQQPDLGDCGYLQAPAAANVAFHVYASGVQIYRWNGTGWGLVGPDAVLSADAGGHSAVGTHYVGPTWETNSGRKSVGTVIDRCTTDPNAVQWLSLSAKSTGPGVLNGVTFIQRVNTVGGKAPPAGGTFTGQEVRVPYSAEYFFYRAP